MCYSQTSVQNTLLMFYRLGQATTALADALNARLLDSNVFETPDFVFGMNSVTYVDGFDDIEDCSEVEVEEQELERGTFHNPSPLADETTRHVQPPPVCSTNTVYSKSTFRPFSPQSTSVKGWHQNAVDISPGVNDQQCGTVEYHAPRSFNLYQNSNYSSNAISKQYTIVPAALGDLQPGSHNSDRQSRRCFSNSPWTDNSCIYSALTDKGEALLFRHFLEYLSPWFDLTDPLGSFRKGVSQAMPSSSILREAVFALSSRHLSDCGKFSPAEADRYQQRCLNSLIPSLSNLSACQGDSLLAATVMLRVTEELEARAGIDSQAHLMGTKAIISSFDDTCEPSSFRKAAFWTGFRQEIGISLRNHEPINIPLNFPLNFYFIDQSLQPTDDGTWANRIIVHLAKVANFCFTQSIESVNRYLELKSYATKWYNSKPLSFEPYYAIDAEDTEGKNYPELWYSSDSAVIAAQYYNIACLLLASFSPETPRIGSSRLQAEQEVDRQLRHKVKEMCGVALSNSRTVPALLLACEGISLCGDRLSDVQEQQALFDVLVKAEKEIAWPTPGIQERLRRTWRS